MGRRWSRRNLPSPGSAAATPPERTFDAEATAACKGVALLLILWHHLFANNPEYGRYIQLTALMAKVCVSMFLILSGYGLSESVKRNGTGLLMFYKNHLARLYLNYWFIAAIFVSFGVFVMGRPIPEAFTGQQPYARFAVQMTGLHQWVFPGPGYNATWWYLSVIIPLYLAFPALYRLTRRFGPWVFAASLAVVLAIPYRQLFTGAHFTTLFLLWAMPFVFGVYLSRSNGINAMSAAIRGFGPLRFLVLGLAIAGLAAYRQFGPFMQDVKMDWLLGTLIVLATFEAARSWNTVQTALAFLGRHMFNIFLFHTFIFLYFWHDRLYSLGHPALIFGALLAASLAISIVLEELKNVSHFFSRLENSILRIPIRERFTI